jgi:integration host factor subunit beta
LTKAELVDTVSKVSDLTRKHSEVIVDAVFTSIIDALHKGEKIELRASAASASAAVTAAPAATPRRGPAWWCPPRRSPTSRPGKELRELINRS